jgi:hypothetical protein
MSGKGNCMPDIDKDTVLVALWTAAILLIGWTWFPAIIGALGGGRYQLRGVQRVENFPANTNDPDYEMWAAQLFHLGYEGVGIGTARIEFFEDQWRIEAPTRVFYSRSKYIHALVRKMPEPWNWWRDVMFVSRLSGGAILMTHNHEMPASEPGSPVFQQGMETFDLVELEQMHLTTLEEFRRRGLRPDSDPDLESLLRALEEAAQPSVKAGAARLGKRFLALHFIIHGCVSLPAGYYAGLAHWGLPLTNLVLALVMRIGESAQKRQIASAFRQAMRDRQRPTPTPGAGIGPRG